MSNLEVIALKSSDDETQQIPNKKKPTPSANEEKTSDLLGLVIKPVKPEVKPALPNLKKVLAGGVTITNIKKLQLPIHVEESTSNDGSIIKFVKNSSQKIPIYAKVPGANQMGVNSLSGNPLNLMKKQQNITVQAPQLNLPPGITVTRTTAQNTVPDKLKQNLKRKLPAKIIATVKPDNEDTTNTVPDKLKQNLKRKLPAKIIATVKPDNEDTTSITMNPKWYLSPEENFIQTIENVPGENKDKQDSEKNNNEQKATKKKRKIIAITIKDHPIQPLPVMRGVEVSSDCIRVRSDSDLRPL